MSPTLIIVATLITFSACDPVERNNAVIIDQLSLTHPNRAFIDGATTILKEAGFSVEYISGDEVIVDLYRTLPERRDKLIILRVHAARRKIDGALSDEVSLFTGEYIDLRNLDLGDVGPDIATAVTEARREGVPEGLVSASRLSEEDLRHIAPVFYSPGEREIPKFGIRPSFVDQVFHGQFNDTVVVMMGCDGLRSDELGRAFVDRGAASFVGWDRPVTAAHTDAATLKLLHNIYTVSLPLPEAIDATMNDIGTDPHFGSTMKSIP